MLFLMLFWKLLRFLFWNGLLLYAIWYISQHWVAPLLPFGIVGEVLSFIGVFIVISVLIAFSPFWIFFNWD